MKGSEEMTSLLQAEQEQESSILSIESIQAAANRICNYVHKTPVITSSYVNHLLGKNVFFKCEYLQKTGSFKARGATNAVMKNDYTAVCTHSSGNHGQALSWAAKVKGIPAHIVMPSDAPLCKQNGVAEYDGKIVFCEPNLASRESTAARIMQEMNASFVHPYDNIDIMSGQGTIALEFLEQVPDLDVIIVPIGGGGMCSGVTVAAKALKPTISIVAAEPEAANDAYRSKMCGEKVGNPSPPRTIADGLKTNLGNNTWPIIRDKVDDVFTATEDEIRFALRLVWERMKCVIEPSAAVGLAVALNEKFREKYGALDKVGIILCGGNIDMDNLAKIFNSSAN